MHAIPYLKHYISVQIFDFPYTICIVPLTQCNYPCLDICAQQSKEADHTQQ